MSNVERPARDRAAPWLAAAMLVATTGAFALTLHRHYPIQHWLFWRFAAYAMLTLFFCFSCLSAGVGILRRVARPPLPVTELLPAALAMGIVVYFIGVFVVGLCGGLGAGFAIVWPGVLCLVGGRRAARYLRRLWRVFAASRDLRPSRLVVAAFGLVGLGMMYFAILSPDNLGFDSRWYHLPIAEHYVAAGRIGPFAEGWYIGAYPHLATIIYMWAYLLPGAQQLDRILLAAHLEFALFAVTLASIPVLVRRLVGGPLRWEGFAAAFLFPALFLYDGSLFVAADHVLALFAIPVFLSLLRVVREPSVRRFVVLSVLLAGALLTKYQAVYLLPAVAVGVGLALARAKRRGQGAFGAAVQGVGAALVVGLIVTAPHWLANWCWYGDPVYPMLHARLADRPWSVGAERRLDTFLGTELWTPHGSFASKLADVARALVTFSVEPHDWPTYHGKVPVFGSLFTITSLLLPFLKGARRTAGLALGAMAGVAIWFSTSHQDRYLQCLLPWMAVATLAVVCLVWRQLPSLRAPLAAAIGLQIIWGGDVYFIPANDDSYEVDRPSPVKAAVDLLSSGYRGDYEKRLHPFDTWEAIGNALPPDAKVLLHERYLHLGLARMAVSDLPGWQGGISYEDLVTSRAIAAKLRQFGVTHVVWETDTSHESDSFTGDLAFFRFVTEFTESPRQIGYFTLAKLSSAVPPVEQGDVAWYGCDMPVGELRRLDDLDSDSPPPPRLAPLVPESSLPSEAELAVVNRDCHTTFQSAGWSLAAHRGHYDLWVHRGAERVAGGPDRP
jgi:hypothetical protein